ncbi:MAG: hypothetical protein MUP55_01430 [Candidatus Aenigmarchaeota archaeon]|nr:hypothetical protein [Candidatus Aenigmarchaeota archaeon]
MPNFVRARVNLVSGTIDDIADYNRNVGFINGVHMGTGRGPLGLVQPLQDKDNANVGRMVQRSGSRQLSISLRGALPTGDKFISIPIEVKNDTDTDIEAGYLQLQCDVTINGTIYTLPVVMRGVTDGSAPVVILKGQTYSATGLFVPKVVEGKQATLYLTRTKPTPVQNWSGTATLTAGQTVSLTLTGSGSIGGVPIPPPFQGGVVEG